MSRIEGRRVVVTGVGAITAAGAGFESLWKVLCEGDSCIGPIERIPAGIVDVYVDAEIRDYDPVACGLTRKQARRLDPFAQFALIATREAVEQSGIDFATEDIERCGVTIGSGIGGFKSILDSHAGLLEKGTQKGLNPLVATIMEANMAGANVALEYGLKGANVCVTTACASGAHSIGEAVRSIRHGYTDVMLAGGAEAALTDLGLCAFANISALNTQTDPLLASLPFDARRGGFVMGEGAGTLVLESLEHAQARGAHILGEIVGFGTTCDAYHLTAPAPDGDGPMRAMRMALDEAGAGPDDLDYLNAHGTGTKMNDAAESKALHLLCGDHTDQVLVSSVKGNIGHSIGAAGAIEAAVTLRCIAEQKIPGTFGYAEPDPDCNVWVSSEMVTDHPIDIALSNSLGFGGHNASLAFKRFEG